MEKTKKKRMEVKVVNIKVLRNGVFDLCIKICQRRILSFLRREEEIILKFVDCPNIIQCYGGFTSVEREQGMVYNMFFEYALGGSPLDLMNRYGGKIPERDVNCYTLMILEGLLDIHKKGYIHSNLKPGNILVFPLQHGTRYYMSPELIVGEVTGTLDIWSLGCIVVQMITGRLLWDTCDGDELRDKLLR
ncbi:hypothetical protein V6Z12_A11G330400 [Gossypium hirsutum]